jgi:hypothetical protein
MNPPTTEPATPTTRLAEAEESAEAVNGHGADEAFARHGK